MKGNLLFVSFAYTIKNGNKQQIFCNGMLEAKEPKNFDDIECLENRIKEQAKKQNIDMDSIILINWKVLNKDEVQYKKYKSKGDENERKNRKNQRVGYFSK